MKKTTLKASPKPKHKHSWIRMAAEHQGKSLYEYFRCQCLKTKTLIDGKTIKIKKKRLGD